MPRRIASTRILCLWAALLSLFFMPLGYAEVAEPTGELMIHNFDPETGKRIIPNERCLTCHGDENEKTDVRDDGTTVNIFVHREQIEATGAVYLGSHPYWDVSGVDPDILQTVRDAIWNWEYVKNDGSLGVHNNGYAVGLLQVSYEALTGEPLPDADLRYVPAGFGSTIVNILEVNGGAPVEVGGAFTVDFTIEDDLGNKTNLAG